MSQPRVPCVVCGLKFANEAVLALHLAVNCRPQSAVCEGAEPETDPLALMWTDPRAVEFAYHPDVRKQLREEFALYLENHAARIIKLAEKADKGMRDLAVIRLVYFNEAAEVLRKLQ